MCVAQNEMGIICNPSKLLSTGFSCRSIHLDGNSEARWGNITMDGSQIRGYNNFNEPQILMWSRHFDGTSEVSILYSFLQWIWGCLYLLHQFSSFTWFCWLLPLYQSRNSVKEIFGLVIYQLYLSGFYLWETVFTLNILGFFCFLFL